MGSAVLFILRSRLLVYSAEYVVNRVHVVLSGFSVKLLCFIQAIVFVCHQNHVCEYSISSVYVGGYCGLSKSELVSSVSCVHSAFL